MSTGDEDFGFVSRDPALLDRAAADDGPVAEKQDDVAAAETNQERETGGMGEADKFRSPPDGQETTAEVNTPPAVTDNENKQQGDSNSSPSVSQRGSMASVASSDKASESSLEDKSKGKDKTTTTEVSLPQAFQVYFDQCYPAFIKIIIHVVALHFFLW
jgi:hypothetical protein